MVKTCAVGMCKSGYKGTPKGTTIFSFPTDTDECEKWIKALPNKIDADKNLDNIGVCIRHWPDDFPSINKKGRKKPANPPSVFDDVPKSFTPQTLNAAPRQLTERKIDFESRQADAHADTSCTQDIDIIPDWPSLVEYIKTLPCYSKE